jgi:hypothetical protein
VIVFCGKTVEPDIIVMGAGIAVTVAIFVFVTVAVRVGAMKVETVVRMPLVAVIVNVATSGARLTMACLPAAANRALRALRKVGRSLSSRVSTLRMNDPQGLLFPPDGGLPFP